MIDAEALARIMREAQAANSVNVSFDANERDRFYDAIKRLPMVSATALQRLSLANFREEMETRFARADRWLGRRGDPRSRYAR